MAVQRLSRTLGVLMLAALVSGCAADPSVEPTPTPTFANEDEAFAAAEATYRAYVDALNQVDLADPATFEEVYAWTTGSFNADERESLSRMHADGWVVSGDSSINSVQRLSVADGSVKIGSCLDVSAIALEDATGASRVTSDRPQVQQTIIEMVPAVDSITGLRILEVAGGTLETPCNG